MFRKLISIFSIALLAINGAHTQEAPPPSGGGYQQLEKEIDGILQRTNTPGAAVALFEPDGSVWRYTPGLKDIEQKVRVDPDTIFRVGSISKMFVGLATMKLVASGELSLDDRLADLAPEVEFENPWEAEHPVRLVHLLNHSTGWDAPHAPELVGLAGEPQSIADTLKRHPHSRYSRWVPGTRSAYNNTGPLVAAYIIEKITGKGYEAYIEEQFLGPLGMEHSGYYYDDQYRSSAASMYRGQREQPYWHLPNRAAGGLHSSLQDMIQFVRFMQHPDGAMLDGHSVRKMEVPTGSSAAAAGLDIDWGIGVTSFHHEGLVYLGHEGALPGAGALIAYQPEGPLGHIVLTNGDGPAAGQIHKLLASYAAENFHTTSHTVTGSSGAVPSTVAGYYRVISPIAERNEIVTSLIPWKVSAAERSIFLSPVLGGKPQGLLSSGEGKFLQQDTGRTALVLGQDPLAGSVLHYGPMTLKKISFVEAIGPVILLAAWLLCLLLGVVYLIFWLPRQLVGRGLAKADVQLRSWPMFTVAGLLLSVAGLWMIRNSGAPYVMAASVTLPSLLVFLGTVLFFLGALWSCRVWWQNRKRAVAGAGKGLSVALIFLNAAVSIYLLSFGLIGVRLWG
ncbi:serine hydrolase [Microbulbifer pacificus]|uniref:Serine hydrolase n=1 Tax=Microbulbifer pacificus TaxID=407164 RepID=A0AAU0MTF7_9GAMM|nr:serine hydrolase [Microbulbifer pacificus]WOX03891.1 serine hydrolase [Microbulbifer pacificus]